ncbi:hypothetical protein FACS1894184_18910 [Clostridia bacterium]|nr:hypothetical protein FACS1894184_18910 [Clostridia bacterium]
MSREFLLENAIQQKQRKSVNNTGLGKVTEFDEKKGTIDVKPIEKRLVNGEFEERPHILAVPIAFPSGGGFTMSRHYKKGETVMFAYADHDIDIGMAKGSDYDPNTQRSHQGTDAVVIGTVNTGGGPASRLPPGTFGIGTADGLNYVTIFPDGRIDIISTQPVNVKTDLDVNVEAGTTVIVKAGVSATVEAPEIMLKGNVTIDGNLSISGNLAFGGSITPHPH